MKTMMEQVRNCNPVLERDFLAEKISMTHYRKLLQSAANSCRVLTLQASEI